MLILSSIQIKADFTAYQGNHYIRIENSKYSIYHFHNWSILWDTIHMNLDKKTLHFSSLNNYSYIKCYDKSIDSIIFMKPCPAATYLHFDSINNLIIGLSSIMIFNEVRYFILDLDGNLINYGTKLNLDSAKVNCRCSTTNYFGWYNEEEPMISITENEIGYIFSFVDILNESKSILINNQLLKLPDSKYSNLLYPTSSELEEVDDENRNYLVILIALSVLIFYIYYKRRKKKSNSR